MFLCQQCFKDCVIPATVINVMYEHRYILKKGKKKMLQKCFPCAILFSFLFFCLFFKKSRHTQNKEFQWRITRCLVCFRVHCVRFNLLQELSVAPCFHIFYFSPSFTCSLFVSFSHKRTLRFCPWRPNWFDFKREWRDGGQWERAKEVRRQRD